MKPLGPVPDGFGVVDGVLTIDGISAEAIVAKAGGQTPLFVYSRAMVARRVADLRAAMPDGLGIHYAMKANPFAPLLRAMVGMVDGFDIASGGELAMALEAGQDPARISFAGPGKRDAELEAAIAAGVTLNLESEGEARRALAVADRLGLVPRLAIRVNPDFGLAGSGMKMGQTLWRGCRACPRSGADDRGGRGLFCRLSHLCRVAGVGGRCHHRHAGTNRCTGRSPGRCGGGGITAL